MGFGDMAYENGGIRSNPRELESFTPLQASSTLIFRYACRLGFLFPAVTGLVDEASFEAVYDVSHFL